MANAVINNGNTLSGFTAYNWSSNGDGTYADATGQGAYVVGSVHDSWTSSVRSLNAGEKTSNTAQVALDDMPTDFADGGMTAITARFASAYGDSWADDTETCEIKITDSTATTDYVAWTTLFQKADGVSLRLGLSQSLALTLTAAGLAASRANWNGAVLHIRLTDAATKGSDGSAPVLSGINFYITYTLAANRVQKGFRWRNDDGSQTAATWAAAANTPLNGLAANDVKRLRFLLAEDAGGNPDDGSGSTQGYLLAYKKNGATAWTLLTTTTSSANPYLTTSSNVSDGDTTTQQLGSGTFRTGHIDTDNDTNGLGHADGAIPDWAANEETELEWVVKMPSSPNDGDTYLFGVVYYDAGIDTLEEYPGIGGALAQIGDGPIAWKLVNIATFATSFTTPDLSGMGYLDDMVAVVGIALGSDTYTPSSPSGWTSHYVDSGSNLSTVNARIAYKQLSSETGGTEFTWSGQNLGYAAGVWIVYGADTTTPIELSDWTENTGLSVIATPGTTGGADRRCVMVAISNVNVTSISPANWQDGTGTSTAWIRHGTYYDSVAGSQDYTATRSTSGDIMIGALVFQPAGGAQSISVGTASETDSAQTVAPVKPITKAVTHASETDAAQAVAAAKAVAVTEATETDAAQAVALVKPISVPVGEATETDAAQGVVPVKPITVAVGVASETDAAQTVAPLKDVTVGEATETDSAQTVASLKTVAITEATETDAAQIVTPSLGAAQNIPVGYASETDAAQTVAPLKDVTVGEVTETDSAQTVAPLKSAAVVEATEADTAQPVAAAKTVTVGEGTETDSAQTVAPAKTVAVGEATETDSAQTVDPVKPIIEPVGHASETDAAQTVTPLQALTIPIGTATETDSAQAVAPVKPIVQVVGEATETDAAQSVTPTKEAAVGEATEADAAQTVTPVKPVTVAVGTASETDSAQVVQVAQGQTVQVGVASETDSAQTVTPVKPITVAVGEATETDSAQVVAAAKTVAVGNAFEAEDQFTFRLTTSTNVGQNINGVLQQGRGQSFLAQASQAVTGIWASLNKSGSPTDGLRMTIADGLNGSVIATSDEILASSMYGFKYTYTFNFPTAPYLVSGHKYWLRIERTGTGDAANFYYVYGTSSDSYFDGEATYKSSDTWSNEVFPYRPRYIQIDYFLVPDVVPVKPINQPVGEATETDSAQPVTPVKPITVAVGEATETDAAQPVTARLAQTIAVGTASETDTAVAVGVIAGAGTVVPIGVASESDTAGTATPTKLAAVGTVSESESSSPAVPTKAGLIGAATETDGPVIATPAKTAYVGLAAETDLAVAVFKRQTIYVPVGYASELETPRAVVGIIWDAPRGAGTTSAASTAVAPSTNRPHDYPNTSHAQGVEDTRSEQKIPATSGET